MSLADAFVLDCAFSELSRPSEFDETAAHKIAAVYIAAGFDRALVRAKLAEARSRFLFASVYWSRIRSFVYEEAIVRPSSLDDSDDRAYDIFCGRREAERVKEDLGEARGREMFTGLRRGLVAHIRALRAAK